MTEKNFPKFANFLLQYVLDKKENYGFYGDFAEIYHYHLHQKGKIRANIWLLIQVVKSLPEIMLTLVDRNQTMLKNQIKITFRNFKSQKGYTFINLFGLCTGMACCILILLFIEDELSYDEYHEKADSIYRLVTDSKVGDSVRNFALSPGSAGPAFTESLPEVISYTRLFSAQLFGQPSSIRYEDIIFEETSVFFADSSFFNIFTHEFVAGNPQTALTAPNSIVITQDVAQRFFGEDDPMGKVLTDLQQGDFTVTGVVKNVPRSSHFTFNYLMSFTTLRVNLPTAIDSWSLYWDYTYLLLRDEARPEEVESKIVEIMASNPDQQLQQAGKRNTFHLQPIVDIHLTSNRQFEIEANNSMSTIYLFSAVALLILFIACINFMNLSTARSANRAREVGLKKVFGASKQNLIHQFLIESSFMAVIGLGLAALIVWFILPYFNDLTGKALTMEALKTGVIPYSLFGIAVFTGILAGSYPAFFLSAFRPIVVLKGELSRGTKNSVVRKGMVILQFAVSVILIIGTITVNRQLHYMRNKNLGFDKEQILVISLRNTNLGSRQDAIKGEFRQNPDIRNVAFSTGVPGRLTGTIVFLPEGKTAGETVAMSIINTGLDFVSTYGIEIKYGRDFSREFSESDLQEGILINEAAAQNIGWGEEAVGKTLGAPGGNASPRKIVGVVKNFHNKSLKQEIEPLALMAFPNPNGFLSLKIDTERVSDVVDFVTAKWEEFAPGVNLNYYFLDDDFDKKYRSEEKLGEIFAYFSTIAIIIACLGLFGLSSFAAEQKTKEIGVRKVLGASAQTIVLELLKDFVRWVLIANVVAWPVAYYFMGNWMSGFPYRTDIGISTFFFAGILSLVIAVTTISYQFLKAANINPIVSLRSE